MGDPINTAIVIIMANPMPTPIKRLFICQNGHFPDKKPANMAQIWNNALK